MGLRLVCKKIDYLWKSFLGGKEDFVHRKQMELIAI